MSYILEAIKKADQKRKLGSVPDVHTVHEGPAPTAKRLIWPYVLAVALFVNSALIIWWLHPWANNLPNKPPAEPVAARHIAKTPVASSKNANKDEIAKVAPPVAQMKPPENKVDASVSQEVVAPENKVIPANDNSPVETAAVEPVNDDEENIASGVEEDEITDLPMESLDSTADKPQIIEHIGGQSLPDTDYTERDLRAEQKRQKEKEEVAKIPYLRRLPPEFRKDIPEIHISFHSYYYKPSRRLVSINGRIFREGEELKEGLKLEKITPGGIVLSYKDVPFRVKI